MENITVFSKYWSCMISCSENNNSFLFYRKIPRIINVLGFHIDETVNHQIFKPLSLS